MKWLSRTALGITLLAAAIACGTSTSSTNDSPRSTSNSAVCTGGDKLTFHLNVPSDQTYCEGKGGTCFKSTFVTVKTSDGLPVIQQQTGCSPACSDDCQPVGCPEICTVPAVIPSAGANLEWDGTYYLHASCGAAKANCLAPFCATAGTYVATMCAFASSDDSDAGIPACSEQGGLTPKCVEVSFTWPPAAGTVVTGSIE